MSCNGKVPPVPVGNVHLDRLGKAVDLAGKVAGRLVTADGGLGKGSEDKGRQVEDY